MDYFNKYIKYKNKYLDLQAGSMDNTGPIFNFIIDDYFMLNQIIVGNRPDDIADKLRNIDKDISNLLQRGSRHKLDIYKFIQNPILLKKIFEEGMKIKEFKILMKDMKKYKQLITNEWNTKKKDIVKHMKDITHLELQNDKFDVYLLHLKMRFARYNGNNKIILSYKHYWPNINMVDLMHEFLHSILPGDIVSHAIIELATNNELRIRLNKKEKNILYKASMKKEKLLFKTSIKKKKRNKLKKNFCKIQ